MTFGKFGRAKFYSTLLHLRQSNPALSGDASIKKIVVGDEKAVYAFIREKDGKKVLVILNLSAQPQRIKVTNAGFDGDRYNVFMGTKEPLENKEWQLEPWGYAVYE